MLERYGRGGEMHHLPYFWVELNERDLPVGSHVCNTVLKFREALLKG